MKTLIVLVISTLIAGTNIYTDDNGSVLPINSEVAEMHPDPKAQMLIDQSVVAHGGDRYDKAHYSFVFRKKQFEFKNNGDSYHYKSTSTKDGVTTIDVLNNDGFTRQVNGEPVTLTDAKQLGYGNGLNSVIYFATLPYKLQDKAVQKAYKGTATVKGNNYDVVEITFREEGGGTDHDDTFHYWINQSNHRIDFLAYNYKVNRGGVRFRTAQNTREVDGILFQDYINYKAEVGTPLIDLPGLWEEGQLKELSKILTEDVKSLR